MVEAGAHATLVSKYTPLGEYVVLRFFLHTTFKRPWTIARKWGVWTPLGRWGMSGRFLKKSDIFHKGKTKGKPREPPKMDPSQARRIPLNLGLDHPRTLGNKDAYKKQYKNRKLLWSEKFRLP